jgi:thiamine biosynthesis protein ThiS
METAETKTIEIVVNGEPKRAPAGLNVTQLLGWLDADPARVAVELNRAIVRKTEWENTVVGDGAQLEVVWFVGGG